MSSYIVRLWTPAEPLSSADGDGGLRGVVEEVGTGRSGVFVGASQLLAFLEGNPTPVRRQDPADASESTL